MLAGAIAAGWTGPVFIQGDHYQFNAKKYAADPEAMTEEIRKACRDAIAAGYLNVDVDSSTLVDLSQPDADAEQRVNYTRAAEITALIRDLEPAGVTISVGGEIGEVGKQNSTEPELRAYLDGYRRELDARRPGSIGVSKVSVQTGTSHGGVPLPGGGRGRGEAGLRGAARPGRGRPGLRGGRRRAARGQHAARHPLPHVPDRRDGRDPPRDRLPERRLRASGLPDRAPPARSRPGASRTQRTSASPG